MDKMDGNEYYVNIMNCIRLEKQVDLKGIVKIYNSYLQNFEFPIDESLLLRSLEDENFKIFVQDDGSRFIKGFCGIYLYSSDGLSWGLSDGLSAEIGPIGVDKKFLKQHIGTALLKYVLNFAKENKVKKCAARVLDKNLDAIKFFTCNGFEVETTANSVMYLVKFLI